MMNLSSINENVSLTIVDDEINQRLENNNVSI